MGEGASKLVIRLCGVRGSCPAPGSEFSEVGGNTSSVAISFGEQAPHLVLDAGTGIGRLPALMGGKPFRGTLLLSHLHWDHTQGLPFCRAVDHPDASTRLLLPEQGDAESVLARALSPPHFPITPAGLQGEWSFEGLEAGNHELAGVDVTARDLIHKGGRTFGLRISSNGGGALAYMPDHAPLAYGPGPAGFGELHETALELASGADVLIHDAQFTLEEIEFADLYGHATIEYALALAEQAGVGTLVLSHHSPARTDAQVEALRRRYAAGNESVVFGREGDVFELRAG